MAVEKRLDGLKDQIDINTRGLVEQLATMNSRMWTAAGAALGMMLVAVGALLVLYVGHK